MIPLPSHYVHNAPTTIHRERGSVAGAFANCLVRTMTHANQHGLYITSFCCF